MSTPAPVANDLALIEAIVIGDQRAMAALYDHYAPAVLGLALRITQERADAEDVVVDTFAQVWRDAGRFEVARGSVASWVATIARSRSLDLMRSRGRRQRLADAAERAPEDDAPAMAAPVPSPMADLLADERERQVKSALGALPEEQRQALELAYFSGLSQSEIAARLREPLGTVKTRMRLGLRRLRGLLAPLAPGGGR